MAESLAILGQVLRVCQYWSWRWASIIFHRVCASPFVGFFMWFICLICFLMLMCTTRRLLVVVRIVERFTLRLWSLCLTDTWDLILKILEHLKHPETSRNIPIPKHPETTSTLKLRCLGQGLHGAQVLKPKRRLQLQPGGNGAETLRQRSTKCLPFTKGHACAEGQGNRIWLWHSGKNQNCETKINFKTGFWRSFWM